MENKKFNDSPTHMWQRHGTGLQHCKNIIASTTMTYVVYSLDQENENHYLIRPYLVGTLSSWKRAHLFHLAFPVMNVIHW